MAQSDDYRLSWGGLPRVARVLLIIMGVLAFLVIAAAVAVNLYVTAERAEALINEQLGPATDGQYEATLADIRIGILGRSVTLDDLSITPTEEAEGLGVEEAGYHVEMDHFRVSRVGILDYLLNDRIRLGSVRLIRPRIHMETVEAEEEVDFDIDELLAMAEEEPLRGIRIGTFRVEDAHVEGVPAEGFEAMSHTVEGLWVTIDDLYLDPEIAEAEDRFLFARDIVVQLDDYRILTADELYQAALGDLSVSTRDSTLSLGALSLEPAVADEVIFAEEPWGTTRYEIEMRMIDAEGLSFSTMLEEMAIHVRSITADTLHADIFYEETDVDSPPEPFPHEMVQEMETTVAIDEMHLDYGFLRYAMIGPGVEEPGVITIDDIGVSATHLFLASDVRAEQPVAIDVNGLIQGQGMFEAHLEYDLTNPEFALELRGTLGEMPFEAFNELLLNVAGIRFDSGQIHEVSFDIAGYGNISEVELRFMYEDLDVEVVDVVRPGIVEDLAEIVANELLRSDTVPAEDEEDPAFVATAATEREGSYGIGQFLTIPVMEALLDILGRDRLPV